MRIRNLGKCNFDTVNLKQLLETHDLCFIRFRSSFTKSTLCDVPFLSDISLEGKIYGRTNLREEGNHACYTTCTTNLSSVASNENNR